MRPRVARVGDQSADFPPFDGDISRVRGRARRRCWRGSVNLFDHSIPRPDAPGEFRSLRLTVAPKRVIGAAAIANCRAPAMPTRPTASRIERTRQHQPLLSERRSQHEPRRVKRARSRFVTAALIVGPVCRRIKFMDYYLNGRHGRESEIAGGYNPRLTLLVSFLSTAPHISICR
jgi:hypothetical protein